MRKKEAKQRCCKTRSCCHKAVLPAETKSCKWSGDNEENLQERSANPSPWTQANPLSFYDPKDKIMNCFTCLKHRKTKSCFVPYEVQIPVVISKVYLKYTNAHLFVDYLWLLYSTTEELTVTKADKPKQLKRTQIAIDIYIKPIDIYHCGNAYGSGKSYRKAGSKGEGTIETS